jgi:hypothetical protein
MLTITGPLLFFFFGLAYLFHFNDLLERWILGGWLFFAIMYGGYDAWPNALYLERN